MNLLSRLSMGRKVAIAYLSTALPCALVLTGVLAPGSVWIYVLVGLGVALGAGASYLIWTSDRDDTERARAVVQRLAAADFSPFDTGGPVLDALESVRAALAARDAAEREAAIDAKRVRVALDKVTTNVMVADADGRIIYMNEALTAMFRQNLTEIRRQLPAFDPDRVLNANFDGFHQHPGQQRNLLAGLRGSHTADMKLGGAELRIVASPVVDEDGKRLGTVVQWIDRTAEARAEEEVRSVVGAANEGDLTKRIATEGKSGFYATLASGINSMIDAHTTLVEEIRTATREVTTSADEISKGNLNLSQRTEEQASSLEETASSMEEMTSTVRQNADNASQANQLAAAARSQAERGGAVVSEAVTAMQGINASSSKIADIIGVIDEIAFQTNLLALNAAVEAARAGDQGRGFAVVASEVRTLASRSAAAAKEIKALIQDSVGRVAQGSKLVDESGRTLAEIVASVKKVTDIVSEIAAASHEQAAGIEQVNKAVTSMDEVTQQNAALVEQAAAAAESLVDQARKLDGMLTRYTVNEPDRVAPLQALVAARPASPVRAKVAAKPARAPASRPAPARASGSAMRVPVDESDWDEL